MDRKYVKFVLGFPTKTDEMPHGMYWIVKALEEILEAERVVNECVRMNREPNDQERGHLGEEFSDTIFCVIRVVGQHNLSPYRLPDLVPLASVPAEYSMVPAWKYWVDEALGLLGSALELWNHCVEENRAPYEEENKKIGTLMVSVIDALVRAAQENGIPPESLPELNQKKLTKRIREGRYL